MTRELNAATAEITESWVDGELRTSSLCDRRLDRRYRSVLKQMSQMPQAPFTQSSAGLAEMMGAYRFIENEKVTVDNLHAPHRTECALRAAGAETVLLIQDTTYFDFRDHLKCTDLQPLRPKHTPKALWLHATLCVLPNGLPLGLADIQFMTGHGKGTQQATRPIEEKYSYRWLKAVERTTEALRACKQRIWLCDREADFYEFFDFVTSRGDDYVVRGRFMREINEPPFFDMRQALEKAPICGHVTIKAGPNDGHARRDITLAIRFIPATLTVPRHKQRAVSAENARGFVVEATEVNPSDPQTVSTWCLLTSLPVHSFEDAVHIVKLYRKRWAIEEFFKVLKSGCRSEQAQFHTTSRISKYITLSAIVAWRLYYLVHVHRVDPDAPAAAVLAPNELATLQMLLDAKRMQNGKLRRFKIRTARHALVQLAALGGFMDSRYAFPGTITLWRGTMALAFATIGAQAQKLNQQVATCV